MEVPDDFHVGEWLRADGPESDIAVCTRVRLARNLRDFTFSPRLQKDEAEELTAYLNRELSSIDRPDALHIMELDKTDELDRQLLIERHLISREHATASRARSLAVNDPESIAVMVNEEDHIRAQVFQSGLQTEVAFQLARQLDEAIMNRVSLAFSEEFGFLTACPTNAGTGLRVSVMLHLPGLVWAEHIDKVTNTAQKIHLAVRGLYGEGSRASGDFYQVSNQVTLGRTEDQILRDVSSAVLRFLEYERDVREALMKGEAKAHTMDRIHRALATLERAHILTSEEALNYLSAVRFGVHMGVLSDDYSSHLNRALLLSQPAHLQRVAQTRLNPAERDQRRAELLAGMFGSLN